MTGGCGVGLKTLRLPHLLCLLSESIHEYKREYTNKKEESVKILQVHKQRIWEPMISIFSKTVKMQEGQEKNWEMESGESLPRWIGCTFLIRMLAKDFLLLEKQMRSSLCENTSDGSKITRNLISSTSCQFSQTLYSGREHWWVLCVEDRCSLYSL